jgi:hypothetical protein
VSARTSLPAGWADPELGPAGNAAYRLLRALERARVERFLAALPTPEQAQREALGRVLDAARGTGFAVRHGLHAVRTLEEYRRAVPIRPWDAFADDLTRAAAGDPGVLVRHPVLSFVKTSGTTGTPKLLPVTDPWAAEVADAQRLWVLAMVAEQAELSRGMVLASVGKAVEGHTSGGLPFGSNTGRMAAAQPFPVRSRFAVPAEVLALDDPELRTYVMLRIALALDVRTWTTANPSTVLAACRAMTRHREALTADLADGTLTHGPAAALTPGQRRRLWAWLWKKKSPADFRPLAFWKLAAVNCWKGGAAPFFVERFPEALGGRVTVREAGISASEGYFAIPLHSSWTGGVAWSLGHLIELVPVEGGDPRSLHELDTGAEYRLVISTTAGLYRYDLDDILRVEGWWRGTPLLSFRRKGLDVLSVTGEKVTAAQAAEAMRIALAGAPVAGFSVGVRMAEVPAYVVAVEGAAVDAAAFDRALRALNVEYASKRDTDRLGPPEPLRVRDGTYEDLRRERMRAGAADGQVKDPIVVDGELLARLRR